MHLKCLNLYMHFVLYYSICLIIMQVVPFCPHVHYVSHLIPSIHVLFLPISLFHLSVFLVTVPLLALSNIPPLSFFS